MGNKNMSKTRLTQQKWRRWDGYKKKQEKITSEMLSSGGKAHIEPIKTFNLKEIVYVSVVYSGEMMTT